MRRPFSLYKENTKSGAFWYARFWDETLKKYKHSRSTGVLAEGKKERRYEAEQAARKILEKLAASPQTARDMPGGTNNKSVADTPLIEYLSNFWTPDSEYARFKRDVKRKPLTPGYVHMNHEDIRRHVEPFPLFSGVTVGSLNKAILKKWLIWLAVRKKIVRKKDGTVIEGDAIAGRRANIVIQAVRVAIRWAVDNEEIQVDPFRKLGEVYETTKEKGILTFEERKKLAELPVSDYRRRLAMLLGSCCGLRRGEMRGLQWGDISDGVIFVRHNFIDKVGVTPPKYNSVRKVPITTAVQKMLDAARKHALNTSPDSFIFESPQTPGKPIGNNFFRDSVTKELENLGISAVKQKERNITTHSLRHTFITLAQLSGLPYIEIMAFAGHKSEKVMMQYSHAPQVIDFEQARKKLEAGETGESEAANG